MAPNCTGMVSDKWERGSVTYHVHILFVQATETENETFPWWLLSSERIRHRSHKQKGGEGKTIPQWSSRCASCAMYAVQACTGASAPHCLTVLWKYFGPEKSQKKLAKFAVISRLQATTLPPLECHIVPARKRPSWQEWTLWAKWWLHVEGNVISYIILVCVYIYHFLLFSLEHLDKITRRHPRATPSAAHSLDFCIAYPRNHGASSINCGKEGFWCVFSNWIINLFVLIFYFSFSQCPVWACTGASYDGTGSYKEAHQDSSSYSWAWWWSWMAMRSGPSDVCVFV